MLRKKTSILWALTEPGIMIQNLENNHFIELGEVQEKIWSYIDGTHTSDEITEKLRIEFHDQPVHSLQLLVRQTLDYLLESELITES